MIFILNLQKGNIDSIQFISNMKRLLMIMAPIIMMTGCSHKNITKGDSIVVATEEISVESTTGASTQNHNNDKITAADLVTQRPSGMIPKATAFKMNGNYENNVAVTFGQDGNLIYFPAPSDISTASMPTDLGEGWWLNNQGISKNSVFTTFTFEDYAALPKTPSIEELKAAVIPGSGITEIMELPYNIGEAKSHISEIKEFVKTH